MEAGAGRTGNRRIALLVQYDGTRFNGWQVQNGGRTVQGEMEGALKTLTGESVRMVASGRTDAGVHALGQVVHFDLVKDVPLKRISMGLNGILDRDIAVKNAFHVPSGFHARFDAASREYLYLIYNHPQRSAFMRDRALWVRERLDADYLRKACNFLIGEQDFASFCKAASAGGNTIRRIEEIEISGKEGLLVFRVRGNAFLHNMIRIIIGTLLDMHREKRDAEYMREVLEKRDRTFSGITAPPCALYLYRITYTPSLEEMESAF